MANGDGRQESLPWKARTRTCLCYMTRIPRGFDMPATPDRRHTTSFSSSSSELRRKALPKPLFSCTLPPFIPHRQHPTSQTNLPEPPSTFDAFDRHHSRLYSRRLLEGTCEMYVAGRTTIHTHTHTPFKSSRVLREASVERTTTLLLT